MQGPVIVVNNSPFSPWVGNVNAAGYALYSVGTLAIGAPTALSPLTVVGPGSITAFTGTTRLGVTLSGQTGVNQYAGIDFTVSTNSPFARIAMLYTAGGSYLQLGTSNNFTSGITNSAVTIDPNGNVGIGTATPLTNLHVAADVTRQLYLTSSSSPTTKQVRIGFDVSNNTGVVEVLLSGSGAPLLLNPTGGAVLIGRTSASYSAALEVHNGRAYVMPNSEIYGIGVAYNDTVGGACYIGASNSNTPDLIFSNSAGSGLVKFLNGGGINIPSLPSSNPGAGTKQLWYDPSDSNRVKFAS